MISRRNVLAAAAIVALAAPNLVAAESTRVMRFIPQSELKSIDPAWIPAANVRTHGYLVFDTLYGIDGQYKPQPQMIGSGPYRYKADERVSGAHVVYERNQAYHPRADGKLEWTAGPKIAHFDRIEWNVIPDAATAAAALQNAEADRWEYVNIDLVPLLRQAHDLKVAVLDETGLTCNIRMNQAIPPFDEPAVRQAVLRAVNQEDYMVAIAGADPTLWRTDFGFFTIGSPMANTAGLDVLHGKHDPAEIRQALADAGYCGEKVGILVASDVPTAKAASDVCADMLRRIGMNVDYLAMDWGMVAQRRMKKDPEEVGGWNIWIMPGPGLMQFNPVVSGLLRTGPQAYFGWPTGPRLEQLRSSWLEAPDLAAQKTLCEEIQRQAFIDLPMIPLGQYFQPTAYRTSLTGVLSGFATFWNVRRA